MKKKRSHDDCSPSIVQSLLGLVMKNPPSLKTIEAWSPSQRVQAEDWAAREHLGASDNPVRRRPRPSFIND